ncbi:MAG: hypothetical protein AAFR27_03265, partial [Pseudomonadota bacterium]
AIVGDEWLALKGVMEAVPQGCEVYQGWQTLFDERGWPWLPNHDGMRVVYFPKGGPHGLAAFQRALSEQSNTGGADADAA